MATWRLGTRSGGQGRHRPGVEALWRRCRAAGDFYLHSYEGAYCPGCEQFYTPGELIDGRPDRAMDRYAVRRAGGNIIVDTAAVYQQDTAQDAWNRAVVTVG